MFLLKIVIFLIPLSIVIALVSFIVSFVIKNQITKNSLRNITRYSLIALGLSFIGLYVSLNLTEPDISLAETKILRNYPSAKNIELTSLKTIEKYKEYEMYISFELDGKKCSTMIRTREKDNDFDTWITLNEFQLVCR